MRLVYDRSPEVADWVAGKIFRNGEGFYQCSAIGVEKDGALIFGAVFHNWQPSYGVIEISGAATSPIWGTKRVFSKILEYPFSFCRMVVFRFSETNKMPARICEAAGAKQYRIPDYRGDGEAEILATLHVEDWRKSRYCNG